MKIKASQTANRVLIKQTNADEMVGTMILPSTVGEKPATGIVKSVSEYFRIGETIITPIVKEGDEVQYNKHAGNETKIDGEEYIIVNEYDIYVIL